MKLLLTSSGIRNESLATALLTLVGMPPQDIKVAVIPTALNTEPGDKGWFFAHMTRLHKLGVGQIDIVDISALPKDLWLPRLEAANVIFVSGGNPKHLMQRITQSGLRAELKRLLKSRVYVGVSAGSYAVTPEIRTQLNDVEEAMPGLGYTDFAVIAHYKNPNFPRAETRQLVEERAAGYACPVYVLDDESAVQVVDGTVEVISEGEHLLLNQ
jgi:dipeptidase E